VINSRRQGTLAWARVGGCGSVPSLLVLFIILVIAAVVVYAIWAVKPKRVKFRADLGKITLLDFEADAGNQSAEPDAIPPVDQPKELPRAGMHYRAQANIINLFGRLHDTKLVFSNGSGDRSRN
jgi:hypothetical protein